MIEKLLATAVSSSAPRRAVSAASRCCLRLAERTACDLVGLRRLLHDLRPVGRDRLGLGCGRVRALAGVAMTRTRLLSSRLAMRPPTTRRRCRRRERRGSGRGRSSGRRLLALGLGRSRLLDLDARSWRRRRASRFPRARRPAEAVLGRQVVHDAVDLAPGDLDDLRRPLRVAGR